jgi:hypothetical protein
MDPTTILPSEPYPRRWGEFAAGLVGPKVTNPWHKCEIKLTRGRLVAAARPEMALASDADEVGPQ